MTLGIDCGDTDKGLNVTHTVLAEVAGTTPTTVAACEHGATTPTTPMVAAWAARLGCRADQLRSTTPTGPDEYWSAANQAMGAMSTQDLAVVADVILRNRARRTEHPDSDRRPDG
jgi:hypothetical protein